MTVAQLLLSELTPLIGAQHGTFYITDTVDETPVLSLLTGYAIGEEDDVPKRFKIGQGLVGQCAREKERILVTDVPGDYVKINSSLGGSTPLSIVVLPVLFEGDVKAAIELASFGHFNDVHLAFLDQLTQSIGIVLNTIAATMRTEQLLQQSQALAEELRSQQLQFRTTNAELQEKAQLLAEQKTEVETKNLEVEQAKKALEEKAEQLSLTSKYKSEFLANMSHELRTPLNNLLILARMLSENSDKNLTTEASQVRRNDSHVGNRPARADQRHPGSQQDRIRQDGPRHRRRPLHRTAGLLLEDLPPCGRRQGPRFRHRTRRRVANEIMHTDAKRLQQVLKNLLSNALKFTEHGSVQLTIDKASERMERRPHDPLPREVGDRFHRDRQRHRDSGRQAAHHL